MKPSDQRGSGRRGGRGQRRSNRSRSDARPSTSTAAPQKKTLWQKIVSFFKKSDSRKSAPAPAKVRTYSDYPKTESRQSPKPELVEVTSAKLYVGNLSYDASESDLFELFKESAPSAMPRSSPTNTTTNRRASAL